jgi:hypothetical protein
MLTGLLRFMLLLIGPASDAAVATTDKSLPSERARGRAELTRIVSASSMRNEELGEDAERDDAADEGMDGTPEFGLNGRMELDLADARAMVNGCPGRYGPLVACQSCSKHILLKKASCVNNSQKKKKDLSTLQHRHQLDLFRRQVDDSIRAMQNRSQRARGNRPGGMQGSSRGHSRSGLIIGWREIQLRRRGRVRMRSDGTQ